MPNGVAELSGDVVLYDLNVTALAVAGELLACRMPFAGVVTGAYWVPSAAVTANVTNYSTLGVRNRGAAGAGANLPATRSYAATNSVAFVAEAMTLDPTVANRQFAAGDVLTIQAVEAGTGLALPAGVVTLHVQWR